MTKSNNKLSEAEAKIIKQIEYYFGDVNLLKDKFLIQETTKNDGWVSIETLLTFKKLKSLDATIETILNAFHKYDGDLVEIDEEELAIKRSKPLPEQTEEYIREIRLRSIHLKGFPLDTEFDEIKEFCEQYGDVESIEMRRTKQKTFKGCCFVVFKTLEDAERALNGEHKYKENDLKRENKEQYLQRKAKFYESLAEKKKNKKQKKEMDSPVDEKKNKKEKKMKIEEEEEEEEDDDEEEQENDDDEEEEADEEETKNGHSDFKKNVSSKVDRPNAVLKLTNLPDRINLFAIKDYFKEFAFVEFVDVEGSEAFVRFNDSGLAKVVYNKVNNGSGKTQIQGNNINLKVLTGDEEVKYWEDLNSDKPKSSIMKIANLPDGTTFGDIKDELKKIGEFGFVIIENSSGYIKFNNKSQAEKLVKKLNNSIELKGETLTVSVLSGAEEEQILSKAARNNDRRGNNDRRDFGGRGGRGGRGRQNHQRGGGYQGGDKRKSSFQGGRNNQKKRF